MARIIETVLYYNPDKSQALGNMGKAAKLKAVLIQMKVRIRNITPEQVTQTVGYLAGMEGFEEREISGELPVVEEEMLVLKNFTSGRLDELLKGMKKAGVPKVALKAVITDTNSQWTFYELYREIKKEHEEMSGTARGGGIKKQEKG